MKEKNYTHIAHCSNCHTCNTLQIPIGTTIAEFMLGKRCQKCGCNIVESPWDKHKPEIWMEANQ